MFDNWMHLNEVQRADPDQVWKAFKAYFEPKSNFRLARFQLRGVQQRTGEPVDTFVTRLKEQAAKCNFATPLIKEDNVIDQVIKGTVHDGVRKALLDQDLGNLTLDRVLDIARTHEATQAQLQKFHEVDRHVDKVRKSRSQRSTLHGQNTMCRNCGGQRHHRNACPAKHHECHNCHRIGHWTKMCRSRNKSNTSWSGQSHQGYRGRSSNRDRNYGRER